MGTATNDDISKVAERKPIGSNEGDFEEVVVDGFLGFGVSTGCALILLFFSVFEADGPFIASCSLFVGLSAATALLFGGRLFSDFLNENKGATATIIFYLISFVVAVASLAFGLSVAASVCACIALVCSAFLYGKFLGSLARKVLMILASIMFVFAGFTILILVSLDETFRYPVIGGAAFLSATVSVLFFKKKVPYNAFGDAAESKKRSIKVKGNNHTLLMLGFMCGGCVIVPLLTLDNELVVLVVAGSMGIAGVLSLLLGQVDERLYKEMLLKSCAFVTAACLLPTHFIENDFRLIFMAVFLIFVFLNVIVLLNAVVETARFNLINPVWLLGYEGGVFFAGLLAGCALAIAGGALSLSYDGGMSVVLVVAVIVCAYMQISVNYQAYPFEPVIEATPEEKAITQEIAERNGQRKTLYQKKRQYACELYSLSPREREILVTLLKGRDAKYIMDTFYISQSTAKTHIYNIYRKFDVHSRQELLDFIEDIELPPEELEDVLSDEEDRF